MSTEISKKQIILLSVLGVFLIAICYVQFLIRPLLATAEETKQTIETLSEKYDDLVVQSNSYEKNQQVLAQWKEQNELEANRLFPLSQPQQIDRFLTFVIGECDASINSLVISDILAYYVDGEGNMVLATPSSETAQQNTGTTESESSTTDPTAGYTLTGEYRCDLTYTIEGNYEDMNQILNFVNNLSFLGITTFSFESISEQDNPVLVDNYLFTITITAYMYKDPLADTDAGTNTESEAAEEIADSAAQQATEQTADSAAS